MAKVVAEQDAVVGASPELVYRLIADDAHHRRFLPPEFSGFETLAGGVGAGTMHRFTVSAGGRTRGYTMRVAEPEPGRVITETDQDSSLVTSYTVSSSGASSKVRISTSWDGAGGVGGFFERLFAPRALRRIYSDLLTRLDRYAREQATAGS